MSIPFLVAFEEHGVRREYILDCNEVLIHDQVQVVPRFTRKNVVEIVKWLWRSEWEEPLDLTLTYEQDRRAPRVPYLLDIVMKLLEGGIYTVQLPTDYGKSTAIEMSIVCALIFWPQHTPNVIVKRNEDAAVAAARTVWWKLNNAARLLPYCQPLSAMRQGNPEVKKGFWIDGSESRLLGGRDPSVYPAGIGDTSLPGRRGRAHLDDLEDENLAKSAAKMDTLRKQVNSTVRLIQRGRHQLFSVFGTPAAADGVMFLIRDDLSDLQHKIGMRFEMIVIPRRMASGQLLWPHSQTKFMIQSQIMEKGALQIAYDLQPPGSSRYSGSRVSDLVKSPSTPFFRDEDELREWIFQKTYSSAARSGAPEPSAHARRLAYTDASIYVGWDPATTGTFALSLVCFLPSRRLILRSRIDSDTSDQQAKQIREWRRQFPSAFVILEADATQLSFASVLSLIDPSCPWAPHMTHGYNKEAPMIGIPSMMQEFMEGRWTLPWDEEMGDYWGDLLQEFERWGPVSHPHGIPSLWFPWFFHTQAMPAVSQAGPGQAEYHEVTMPHTEPSGPSQPLSGAASQASEEAWRTVH